MDTLPEGFLDAFAGVIAEYAGPVNLDAMCGDGNMMERVRKYLHPIYSIDGMDSSTVYIQQVEERKIDNSELFVGDILTWDHPKLKRYDLIYITSATHEIPYSLKEVMYSNIHNLLKSGGVFINCDALCGNRLYTYAFNTIIHERDRLAGTHDFEKNRYIEYKREYYTLLRAVGFTEIRLLAKFYYKLSSHIVRDMYFGGDLQKEEAWVKLQRQWSEALPLEYTNFAHGRHSELHIPGEVTLAVSR